MELIEQENPVAVDWFQSVRDSDTKFKWYYPKEDYKNLKQLNDACNIWFESLSPDIKTSIIIIIEEEAKGAALPNMRNTLEKNSSEADTTRYIDYFTGSYAFFANPTYKTKQYFLSQEPPQLNIEIVKKSFTDEQKKKDFIACFTFMPLFGALGFEGYVKDTYDRLARVISARNRRELLEQLN
jgi:hypothetical protein